MISLCPSRSAHRLIAWFGGSVTYCPPRPLQPFRCPTLSCIMGAIIRTQRHREHGGAGVDGLNVISAAVGAAGVRIRQKLGPGLLDRHCRSQSRSGAGPGVPAPTAHLPHDHEPAPWAVDELRHGHHEGWHPSHCQLSGSRPVAPCPPSPCVRTMPIPCTGPPMIVTVFVNPTT